MADAQGKLPPSKLGEYTVIRDIAEGTFGKVKSMSGIFPLCPNNDMTKTLPVAKHTITGHRVAMKYISKAVILREKTKTRVRREFEYMRTLRHPHIIKLSVQSFFDL
jgi:carbon catabolite-derepressing protein kinase